MRTSSRLLIPASLAALAVSAVDAFGFAEIARGALTLETEARATYDSYFIGGQNPGDEDYYYTLNPALRYVRKAGLAEFRAEAGVSIIRYDTNRQYDSEDFNAEISSTLPVSQGSRLSGNGRASYTESTVVDYDVMDRIRTEATSASLSLQYQLGLKTALMDSVSYSNTQRKAYSDQKVFGNDLSFLYNNFLGETSFRLTHGYTRTTSSGDNVLGAELDQEANSFSGSLSRPLVGPLTGELTYGYRILNRSAEENLVGQTEQSGSFFSLGLRGPFLPPSRFPKVQSSASIVYQESRSPGINDLGQKTITGNILLEWQARERTRLSFNASRSVDLTATDLSVENTQVSFGIDQKFGLATTLRGDVSYIWRKYRGIDRKDETLEGSLGLHHQLTKYWGAGAMYTYQDNSTNGENSPNPFIYRMRPTDFSRHVVSVYVTNVF